MALHCGLQPVVCVPGLSFLPTHRRFLRWTLFITKGGLSSLEGSTVPKRRLVPSLGLFVLCEWQSPVLGRWLLHVKDG